MKYEHSQEYMAGAAGATIGRATSLPPRLAGSLAVGLEPGTDHCKMDGKERDDDRLPPPGPRAGDAPSSESSDAARRGAVRGPFEKNNCLMDSQLLADLDAAVNTLTDLAQHTLPTIAANPLAAGQDPLQRQACVALEHGKRHLHLASGDVRRARELLAAHLGLGRVVIRADLGPEGQNRFERIALELRNQADSFRAAGRDDSAAALDRAVELLIDAAEALEPFAQVGQWLQARDVPDATPVVDVSALLGSRAALTRGHFKKAHDVLFR